MKKNITIILKVLFSIIIAFLIQRTFTIELIMYFAPSLACEISLYLIFTLIQSIFIYSTITLISNRKLDKWLGYLLWVCYFSILLIILFFRFVPIKGINFNPLSILDSLNNDSTFFITIILNIILFIPMGCLFKNKKLIQVIIIGIFLCILIESTQYFLNVGIFDINDIILNMTGLLIGYKATLNIISKQYNRIAKLVD